MFSLRALASSTELLEAPSISTTSGWMPWVIFRQEPHSLQGSAQGACSQLSALEKMRAMVVLPTPRVPQSR